MDECQDCVTSQGLCERCAEHLGPRLATNRRWLLLMGIALIEQRARQTAKTKPAPVSTQQAGWLKRRATARKAARSKRRTAQLIAAIV